MWSREFYVREEVSIQSRFSSRTQTINDMQRWVSVSVIQRLLAADTAECAAPSEIHKRHQNFASGDSSEKLFFFFFGLNFAR